MSYSYDYNNCNTFQRDFGPFFDSNNKPELLIELQPKPNYRLRYSNEGNHGILTHKQTEEEAEQKLFKFPKVRLQIPQNDTTMETTDLEKSYHILVSLHNFANNCLSPHLLVEKTKNFENFDFVFQEMTKISQTEYSWELINYKILRTIEKYYQFSIDEKKANYEALKLPMDFGIIQGNMDMDDEISLIKLSGLNVRLGFTIFEKVGQKFTLYKELTFSEGIFHGDTFRIQKICNSQGNIQTNTEITLLTNFKPKFPMKVLMYNTEWKHEIPIKSTTNDPKTSAITFTGPPYGGKYLNENIEMNLEVIVGDSFYKSNRVKFLYTTGATEDYEDNLKNKLRIHKICNPEGNINEETDITLLLQLYTNCPSEVIMFRRNPTTLNIEWSANIPIKIFNQSAIMFKAPPFGGEVHNNEDIEVEVVVAVKGNLAFVSNSVKFVYKNNSEDRLKHKRPKLESRVPSLDGSSSSCGNDDNSDQSLSEENNKFINDLLFLIGKNEKCTCGNIQKLLANLLWFIKEKAKKGSDGNSELRKIYDKFQQNINMINISHYFKKFYTMLHFDEDLLEIPYTKGSLYAATINNSDNNCILKIQLLIKEFQEHRFKVERNLISIYEIYYPNDFIWQHEMIEKLMDLMAAVVQYFEESDVNALDYEFWIYKKADLAELMKLIRYQVLYYPNQPIIKLPHSLRKMIKTPRKVYNKIGEMIQILRPNMSQVLSSILDSKHTATSTTICKSSDNNEMAYNMNHKKRGLALIFDHEYFDIPGVKMRLNTDVDCLKLENTFKSLDFEVSVFKDCTLSDIRKHINEVAAQDHCDHDCIAISILTQREKQGNLYAKDIAYRLDNILQSFSGQACPTLSGKPKIFIIQACRGTRTLETKMDVKDLSLDLSYHTKAIPVDFLIVDSTIPDFKAFKAWLRNTESTPLTGSRFIHSLAEELNVNGKKQDLLMLLTYVNRRVAKMDQLMEIPCITSSLTRTLRFTDKPKSIIGALSNFKFPGSSLVFILGYINFDNNKDAAAIVETFQSLFNSEIANWANLSCFELQEKIRELKTNQMWRDKFKNCKFISIFYLCHERDDHQLPDINAIKRRFLNPFFKIEELNGKLKWLIVSLCRGNLNDYGYMVDGGKEDDVDIKDNFCIFYSTRQEVLNYRDYRQGSNFINELCGELKRNASKKTLSNILTNVNWSVNHYAKIRNYSERSKFVMNCDDFKFIEAD